MLPEEQITLDCPCCRQPIRRSLNWFKQTYTTCPDCGGGLSAAQFAETIHEIEEAFAASDDELVHGQSCSGGCCKRD